MAAEPDPKHQLIAALVRDESLLLSDFISVLESEQSALTDGRLDDLLSLATVKTDLASRLASIDDQRLRAVASGSGVDPVKDMTTWLAANPQSQLESAWRSLLDAAKTARDLNVLNGKLIAQRMQHNQQALSVLVAAGKAGGLYGPDGQPRLEGAGRSLGSA